MPTLAIVAALSANRERLLLSRGVWFMVGVRVVLLELVLLTVDRVEFTPPNRDELTVDRVVFIVRLVGSVATRGKGV